MAFLKDFKSFALRGNVVDLAVGVIIGAAFGKIVTAVVEDLLMPLIGWVTPSGSKFTDIYYVLKPGKSGSTIYKSLADAKTDGANVFAYGDFIQTIVDFTIIALCIFLMIKGIERMKRKEAEAPAPPAASPTEKLLTEIRDILEKKPQ